ncbi:MAG: hypothetical protein JO060_11850, partial [Candidatus Eremiobacteraeota bacterium]|nr:hypothetical protein [Candidatus Eremiobacteraeota bacterium]
YPLCYERKLSSPQYIEAGADGHLWFVDNAIQKISTQGVLTHVSSVDAQSTISSASNGDLWFGTEYSDFIGKVTLHGQTTTYGGTSGCCVTGLTQGPDGNMWFTEAYQDKIGRISPSGVIKTYVIPPVKGVTWAKPDAYDITVGPDGNLWYTDFGTDSIGRFDARTHRFLRAFRLSKYSSNIYPYRIKPGGDGNMWFTTVGSDGYGMGRVTMKGGITRYATHFGLGIDEAPNGDLWFAEGSAIGHILPKSQTFAPSLVLPSWMPAVSELTFGPDNNIWFAPGYALGYGQHYVGQYVF